MSEKRNFLIKVRRTFHENHFTYVKISAEDRNDAIESIEPNDLDTWEADGSLDETNYEFDILNNGEE